MKTSTLITPLSLAAVILGAPKSSAFLPPPPNSVASGFELLATSEGTAFNGTFYKGVPLGSFDFGGGIIPVGGTDTIIRRNTSAIEPGPDSVPIELVAMHLQSVSPIDLGSGMDIHFLTLQSERGGPPSTGQMTINFFPPGPPQPPSAPQGTFDSFFDIFFDIRIGALDGPIVFSDTIHLADSNVPWTHLEPGDLVIEDINQGLMGALPDQDFFMLAPWGGSSLQLTIVHDEALMAQDNPVPEPSQVIGALALASLAFARRLRK